MSKGLLTMSRIKVETNYYAISGSFLSVIMLQIENEFGSYGDDQAYLQSLVKLARMHLGEDIIL